MRLRRGGAAISRGVVLGVALTAGVAVPALAHGGGAHRVHPSRVHRSLRHPGSKPRVKPLKVRSASLTQVGKRLDWSVQLTTPLSLPGLKRQSRTLCLLIEWPSGGRLRGELCAKAGRGKHFRRLVYRRITDGRAGGGHNIQATITKPTSTELVARFLPDQVGLHYWRLRWQVINTVAGPGCTRLPSGPPRCRSLYHHHGRVLRLHIPRVVGCVARGSSLVFGGPSRRHDIALTFDDGPWPDPPSIDFVHVLARYHVPATFFEIGDQISQYDPGGSVERRMLADGDMIGDHTWSHPNMTGLSASAQRSQLEMTLQAIKHQTGFRTCIWRPPYGAFNSQVVSLARSLGLITIDWDVDTVDWSEPGTATIYQRAVSGAHNGAIILQHFGGGPRYQTLAAVPQEIRTLRRRGYRFVTIPQMLGLRLIYK